MPSRVLMTISLVGTMVRTVPVNRRPSYSKVCFPRESVFRRLQALAMFWDGKRRTRSKRVSSLIATSRRDHLEPN